MTPANPQQRAVVLFGVVTVLVLCAIAAFQNFAPRADVAPQPVLIEPPPPPQKASEEWRDPLYREIPEQFKEVEKRITDAKANADREHEQTLKMLAALDSRITTIETNLDNINPTVADTARAVNTLGRKLDVLVEDAARREADAVEEPNAAVEQTPPPVAPPAPAATAPTGPSLIGKALVQARETGKLVVIVFRQTTCPPCDVLEKMLFGDEFTNAAESEYVVTVACLDCDPDCEAYRDTYKVPHTPYVVVRDDKSMVRIASPSPDAGRFLAQLAEAKAKLRGEVVYQYRWQPWGWP